mmetsp:Transcript_8331/g.21153  ORF Transcript_8331/g.21153 Transcript_8331/m.21153 type:complete len:645 (+) Transcript_8331:251-2185(+)
MEALAEATPEDLVAFPDILCTFHAWMMADGTRKEGTAKSYVRQMAVLVDDDGKTPEAMATDEYLQLTKNSFKNKTGNGQRAAAVRLFIPFWKEMAPGPWTPSEGVKMYQVKGPGGGEPKANTPAKKKLAAEVETEEESQVRTEWAVPSDGWKVAITKRVSGDLVAAISPGGSAYTSKEAMERRLTGEMPPAKPAPSTRPPARTREKAAAAQGESRADAGADAAEAPAVASAGPRRVTLADAVASLANRERAEPLLVSGRDRALPLAQRLNGLYVQTESTGDTPVYKKFGASKKPTWLFYTDEKGGQWRFSKTTTSSGGVCAKNKEKAEKPWLLKKPWMVFGDGNFDEDAKFVVNQLDLENLPADVELEVDEDKETEQDGSAPNRSEVRATMADDAEDAPPDSPAHQQVKWDAGHKRWHFAFKTADGQRITFQATVSATHGDAEAAARVCRLCWMRFQAGDSKEAVVEYRSSLYAKLQSPGVKKAKDADGQASLPSGDGGGETEGTKKKKKLDSRRGKKRKGNEEDGEEAEPNSEAAEPNGSAPKKAAKAETKEEEEVKEEQETKVKSESSASDSESSSSSSSSAEGASAKVPAAPSTTASATVTAVAPQSTPSTRGKLAAKMSVRTGLRCYVHYEVRCQRCHAG